MIGPGNAVRITDGTFHNKDNDKDKDNGTIITIIIIGTDNTVRIANGTFSL